MCWTQLLDQSPMPNDPISFEISCSPSEEDQDLILKGLISFNVSEVGPSNELPLAILARNSDLGNEVVGVAADA